MRYEAIMKKLTVHIVVAAADTLWVRGHRGVRHTGGVVVIIIIWIWLRIFWFLHRNTTTVQISATVTHFT